MQRNSCRKSIEEQGVCGLTQGAIDFFIMLGKGLLLQKRVYACEAGIRLVFYVVVSLVLQIEFAEMRVTDVAKLRWFGHMERRCQDEVLVRVFDVVLPFLRRKS